MTNNLTKGDVVQLSPDAGDFAACFMTVTEPKPWGAQGYVRVPGGGDAYYRAKHEHMTLIGRTEWMRANDDEGQS